MKQLTRFLGGALLFLMPLAFTSCGEADNPVQPQPSTPTTEEETKPEAPTYASALEQPLTFKAAQDNVKVTLKFKSGAKPNYKNVEYSLDKGATWTALKRRSQAILLEKAGNMVMFRGENDTYNGDAQFVTESAKSNARGGTRASNPTELVRISGNIMSMVRKEGWSDQKELSQPYTFKEMFKDCDINIDKDEDFLMPATNITKGCYMGTFAGCKTLEIAPELPAPTLLGECYESFFEGCSKLKGVTLAACSVEAGVKIEDCIGGILKGAGTDLGAGEKPTITFIEPPVAPRLEDGAQSVTVGEMAGAIIATSADASNPDAAVQWSAVVVDEKGQVEEINLEMPIEVETGTTVDVTFGEEDL